MSASALAEAKRGLEAQFSGVRVHPRVADYTDGLGALSAVSQRKLVLYIGSSLGNFEPRGAASLLRSLRQQLAPGDRLLLGIDMVKSTEILLPAYDDAQGVTAAFNKNVLARLNRELGADFLLDAWTHQARWNAAESRIEMHLCSAHRQTVRISALELALYFEPGEGIHTENSYKFTFERTASLLDAAGFQTRREWTDGRGWFGVHLAEAI